MAIEAIVQPERCENCHKDDIIYFLIGGSWVCEQCRENIVDEGSQVSLRNQRPDVA